MSFTFTVAADRPLPPKGILDAVGEADLFWLEEEPGGSDWPEAVLHVGVRDRAARGVELCREGVGIGVRIFACSSREDVELALRFVEAFAQAGSEWIDAETGVRTALEDFGSEYGDEWINGQVSYGPRMLKALVARKGVMTTPGLRRDVFIGPKTIARLSEGRDEASFGTALCELIRRIQWIDEERWYPAKAMRVSNEDGTVAFDAAAWGEGVSYLLPACDRFFLAIGKEDLYVTSEHLEFVAGDRFVEWLDDRQALVEAAHGSAWQALLARARTRALGVEPTAPRPWWRFW